MQEVKQGNQNSQAELDEMLSKISKMARKIKQNPEQVAMLCIETGFEIFTRLEGVAKQAVKDKLSEFLK